VEYDDGIGAGQSEIRRAGRDRRFAEAFAGCGAAAETRFCGIGELDRVQWRGTDPRHGGVAWRRSGIGKSTLLLQAADTLASDGTVLYVSGEESARRSSSAPTDSA
jgi:DNA repair protein RadA/Sms